MRQCCFDLQRRNISRFNVRNVPQTKGLGEQKLRSLDPIDQWWFEKLVEGQFVSKDSFGVAPWGTIQKNIVYEDFADSMRQGRRTHIPHSSELGQTPTQADAPGANIDVRQTINGSQVHHYAFPP